MLHFIIHMHLEGLDTESEPKVSDEAGGVLGAGVFLFDGYI